MPVTVWMRLEDIMVKKTRQSQKDTYCMKVPGGVNFIKTESRTVIARDCGEGSEELYFIGILVEENEKVLEMDDGDGGTWCACAYATELCSLKKVFVAHCVWLCNPTDYSPPGSSVHGISQARILDWLPFPSRGDLPEPGIKSPSPALQSDSFPSEPPGGYPPLKRQL